MNYNYEYYEDNCYQPSYSCFRPSWEKCPLERKCCKRLENSKQHCCHQKFENHNKFLGCPNSIECNIGDCCKCRWNND